LISDDDLQLKLRWEKIQKEKLLDALEALGRENRELKERIAELETRVAALERQRAELLQQWTLW
jgi:predicted nuclease with TOPRIM domain